jgi:hypothetical protein
VEIKILAVHGIYNGKIVVPKETIPYKGTRDVIITFPDIDNDELTEVEKLNALQQLVGIAEGNNMTLDDVKAERLARQ